MPWPNPFTASLIGYLVSSAALVGTKRANRAGSPAASKRDALWFMATGVLNGGAVLPMYVALSIAPVSLVAPVIATYPLVTVIVSAVVLRDEPMSARMVLGALVTVGAIVHLVGSPLSG
jgi:uncharacterized membrane protein